MNLWFQLVTLQPCLIFIDCLTIGEVGHVLKPRFDQTKEV
jgi:hypothetical protein